MINQKNLIGLGVATVAVVAIALAVNHSRKPVSEFSAAAGPLVADLGERLNDVSRMVVTTANKQTAVTLERKGESWLVAERGGYPADLGKLREYLLKLADARLVEKKTANRERHADLGLSDISDAQAKGIAVSLDGLAQPVSFITGIYNAQGGGTYVRRSDEAQTWLATGNLIPDREAASWLHKDLADIPSDRIASVTITHADGKVLRVFKDKADDAHFTIADLPRGREPSSEFAANGLASTLAELRLEDVAPTSDVPIADKATHVHYATFDGVIVDASVWQVGDKHYVSFAASEDGERAARHVDAELARIAVGKAAETEAGAAEGDAEAGKSADDKVAAGDAATAVDTREQGLAAIQAEVDKLNAGFKGWSFILPSYKLGNIDKTMEDLLKPLEAKSKSAK